MTLDALFRAFLQAYTVYYDVRETSSEEGSPFDAEAVFSSTEEEYFLMKEITLYETRIAEYVYFAKRERLTREELERLDARAWEQGLAASEPGPGHKCSDITLIILADRLTRDAAEAVRECRHDKSYRLGLWGFSHYRLAVIENSTGAFFFNGQGTHLKTLVSDIWKSAQAREASADRPASGKRGETT